jgi:O-methyltransferase domain/Dimerisation domain
MSVAFFDLEEVTSPEVAALPRESSVAFESMPADIALTRMIFGPLGARAVYVAAKLGIADLLVDGPKSVTQLAQTVGADAPSLYRVLRALASFDVFKEKADQVFELTERAELLRSDGDTSLRDVAIFMGEDWHWQVWGKMLYSVRTGKSAWEKEHGADPFNYFAANGEAAKIFDRAMSSNSTMALKAVVKAYSFAGIETLVDVAGGHGRLLNGILDANPALRGVLFDLPHVISGARESLPASSVAERIQFATGDFFVRVPEGGDAYIMKHIIHGWDDERALKILKTIKKAMKPGARVLLVELVIKEGAGQDLGKLIDIEMLVSPGGKERTAGEYQELFAGAGLRLTRIVPTESPFSVIEAVAA